MSPKNIAFIGTLGVSDDVRLGLAAYALDKRGYQTTYVDVRHLPAVNFHNFHVIVFNRPVPPTQKIIDICKRLGIKVVIDQDDDFESIPSNHVAYRSIGPGNPTYLDNWRAQLMQADLVTLSTPLLAERLAKYCRRYAVIPNGFSLDNPLWHKDFRSQQWVTFGWIGTITHRQDFRLALSGIEKLLHMHRTARILIGLDFEIYRWFKRIPEEQKLFVPMLDYDLYPMALKMCDVLLAPLENTPFNQVKSDIKCVEAGAACIPVLASPVLPYIEWNTGMLLCPDYDWYPYLKCMVEDSVYRNDLSIQGNHKAIREREAGVIAQKWVDIVENL